MRVFRIIAKNIKDAFKSVFRNFSLSLASIICTTITLFLVALAMIASVNVNNFTKELEKDLTIVVFLERDAKASDVSEVKDSLDKVDNIESISYESKESVKKAMQEQSDVFNSIMGSWTTESNPLQDEFLIKVTDVMDISKTAKEIKNIKKIDTVKYGEGMVDQLISVFDVVKKATIGIVIALIIVTAFLIGNTIKLTIFSRKNEIEIMRLVGTSNTVIKLPFVIEGFILGVIGSIIPVVLTIYGYIIAYEKSGGFLFSHIINLVKPSSIIAPIAISLVVIGAVVGMLGSYRSVRKYLKI